MRYIAPNTVDKADANWTVLDNAWLSGGGALGPTFYGLEQEGEATINLSSTRNTYLYLLRGSGSNGAVVEDNDDISLGTNTNWRGVSGQPLSHHVVSAPEYFTTGGVAPKRPPGLVHRQRAEGMADENQTV